MGISVSSWVTTAADIESAETTMGGVARLFAFDRYPTVRR